MNFWKTVPFILYFYVLISCYLFSMSVAAKKQRKAEVMEGIMETMETDGGAED